MNMYAYVGNDPVNLIDPTGLCGKFKDESRGCGGTFVQKLKGNTEAALKKLTNFFESSQETADAVENEISEVAEEITPSRETAHTIGSVTSVGLGVLSVTPACGPPCAYGALLLDGVMAKDLYDQGKFVEAGLTLVPFASGEIAKVPMKLGKVSSSKVINQSATAVSTSAAITIMAQPENQ